MDLSSADQTLDFKYRAPLAVEISGLPDADPTCALAVPVIAQTERYPMTIQVFEDYGTLGRCPVDTGTVTVFDEIIDQEKNPVTLVVKNGEAKLETDNGLQALRDRRQHAEHLRGPRGRARGTTARTRSR